MPPPTRRAPAVASRYASMGVLVLPSELTALPWPALLVGANGAVLAASPEAVALLGMNPSDIAALEDRFELLSASGQPVPSEAHPLRRAARGELFQVGGIWRDRDSERELSLRFRCRAVGPYGLLEIDSLLEDAERRATERLSRLNAALLGRTPGEGFISIRELLLQLVLQACEITGARYGALGVLNPDGVSLKDFIYVGVPEEHGESDRAPAGGEGAARCGDQRGAHDPHPSHRRRSPVGGLPCLPPTDDLVPRRPAARGAAGLRELLRDRQAGRQRVHGRRRTSPRAVQRASITHGRIRPPGGAGGAKALRDRRRSRRPTASSISRLIPRATCSGIRRLSACSAGSRAKTIRRGRIA